MWRVKVYSVLLGSLLLASVAGAGELTIKWDYDAAEAQLLTGFSIERSDAQQQTWTPLQAPIANTVLTFTDRPLVIGAVWCYRVYAVRNQERSLPSNVACGTVPLTPPGNVTVR